MLKGISYPSNAVFFPEYKKVLYSIKMKIYIEDINGCIHKFEIYQN
jgi:hypothetical protein